VFEEKTGFRTRVPGENFVNRAKEYYENAKKNAEMLDPIRRPVVGGILRMGETIDGYLNTPNAEPVLRNYGGGYSRSFDTTYPLTITPSTSPFAIPDLDETQPSNQPHFDFEEWQRRQETERILREWEIERQLEEQERVRKEVQRQTAQKRNLLEETSGSRSEDQKLNQDKFRSLQTRTSRERFDGLEPTKSPPSPSRGRDRFD
jgi:hypothetical protein